jgi:two-component system, sensor histidine kinase ChiS
MIAMVSHDLRGPVATIIMAIDMLFTGVHGPLNDKQKSFLEMMKTAGERLTAFVSNVLDAAKIKAGKLQLSRQTLRLEDVVAPLAEFHRLAADGKGLTLARDFPADLPAVHADREKLEQVINNLIGNAMKFTPRGGRVTLSAEADGGFVRVSVTDTGRGIAPESVKDLFKEFSQLDLADQRAKKIVGTGLGLNICRAIVEAHGGRIWVDSELAKGSSFRFTLPAVRA